MTRWSDVGLDIESEPRTASARRWYVVLDDTRKRVTEALTLVEACRKADEVAEQMREDGVAR